MSARPREVEALLRRGRYLLTLVEAEHAGRTYAAYGAVYIATALGWLWLAEGVKPDRWDLLGAGICLAGALVIIAGPRPA